MHTMHGRNPEDSTGRRGRHRRISNNTSARMQEEACKSLHAIEEEGFEDSQTMRFIEEKYWDVERHGPKPENKAEKHIVSGKERTGWWIKPENAGTHPQACHKKNDPRDRTPCRRQW